MCGWDGPTHEATAQEAPNPKKGAKGPRIRGAYERSV